MSAVAHVSLGTDYTPEVMEKIDRLRKKISPLVRFKEGGLKYIRTPNIFIAPYTWAPKPSRKARGIKPLAVVTTEHPRRNGQRKFGPTIAEVLKGIPEEHVERAVAFEITGHFAERHRDSGQSFYLATVQLYELE